MYAREEMLLYGKTAGGHSVRPAAVKKVAINQMRFTSSLTSASMVG